MALKDQSADNGAMILRAAIFAAERGYDDRWPARGKTGSRGGDYRPLDEVSREMVPTQYKKYPITRGS
jgi:hypothetical protein